MMQSMTGYGRATCELEDKIITIEIKSLNSKQIDIYSRLPNLYKEKDLDIRNLLSQELKRGKVEISITYENTDVSGFSQINIPAVEEYYQRLHEISQKLGVHDKEPLLQTVMRFPDTLKMEKEDLKESDWMKIKSQIKAAVDSINKFRNQEGKALEKDILQRVENIETLLSEITPFEADRIAHIRQKISSNLTELIDKHKVDENRFEQELVYYLEKIDITEEKVRLKNHCIFFKEEVNSSDAIGKKLGFISQEIGREINTIGSKANHSEIQKTVVQMKDELEKIKEQLMNVL